MTDKQITPQESMAIIAQMIDASKQRISMPDLRISVMWAALSIATAAIYLILIFCNCGPWFNYVWFAIPVIGFPTNIIMARKKGTQNAKTYIDRISDGIWRTVGLISIILIAISLAFNFAGYPQAWLSLLFYAFIIVGFGAVAQGLLIRENSYIFGGFTSVIAGFVLIILALCDIPLLPLLAVWVFPLYIVCFLLTFIVPAFIIVRKLKSEKR